MFKDKSGKYLVVRHYKKTNGQDDYLIDFKSDTGWVTRSKANVETDSEIVCDNITAQIEFTPNIYQSDWNKKYTVMNCIVTLKNGLVLTLPLEVNSVFEVTRHCVVTNNILTTPVHLVKYGGMLKLMLSNTYNRIAATKPSQNKLRAYKYEPGRLYISERYKSMGGIYLGKLHNTTTTLFGIKPNDNIRTCVGYKPSKEEEILEVFIPISLVNELDEIGYTLPNIIDTFEKHNIMQRDAAGNHLLTDEFLATCIQPEKVLLYIKDIKLDKSTIAEVRQKFIEVLSRTRAVHLSSGYIDTEFIGFLPSMYFDGEPKIELTSEDMQEIVKKAPDWFRWIPDKEASCWI